MRSYYLANGLKQHGHQVEVITAHNQKQSLSTEVCGIPVHYLPVYYDNKLGFLRRIWAFAKFAFLALRKARTIEGLELCYAISTPLTVAWTALRLKSKAGVPFLFEVGDLWPEAPIQMGAIKNPWLVRALRKFEAKAYREARHLVALSPGIREGMVKAFPAGNPVVVPNMSDCTTFNISAKTEDLPADLNIKDRFVVLYFGAVGRANHLEYLVEAARSSQESPIQFLVAGQGSELRRIKKKAHGISNIAFLNYQSQEGLAKLLTVCDAIYVSYADVPVLSTGSPNKFFDGLAAGKLILLNFEGWLKELCEKHEFGLYIDPKHPQRFAEILSPFMKDRTQLLKFQQNARSTAELYFSKEIALQKILKIIDNEHKMLVKGSAVYTLTA